VSTFATNKQLDLTASGTDLPGLGTNEWLLPAAGDINLKIRMAYENPDIEIQDLDIFAGWTDARSKPSGALVTFLKQFHKLNTRWGYYYEAPSEALVTLCAEIQEDIVTKVRPGRKPMSEGNLLIALALRALALGHYIADVEGWLIGGTEESFIQSMFLEPTTISEDKNPSIIVSRHDPTKDDLGSADGAKLSSMMHDIVRTTQALILRGKASDWPVIFCVLCLIKMIHQSVASSIIRYIKFPPDGYVKYLNVWETLCLLYDASSNGHNPLVDDWDESEYEMLVGNNGLAVDHFRSLNALWNESGMVYHNLCSHQVAIY
jgi:hypothetical protein